MKNWINKNKIWFVHLGYTPPLPLRMEVLPHRDAEVIGGLTGTHRTGHADSYWTKYLEILRLGFIPIDVAKDLKFIPSDWREPPVAELDHDIQMGVYVAI